MQEIRLESLNDGPGVLPFKLGSAKVISHYHSFVQYIDLHDLRDSILSIINQLRSNSPELHTKTRSLFEPHITYLETKLHNILQQLQTFETDRVKRGLVDGLGSVIKSITGNLDYTDAQHYNQAIKLLQDSENKIVTELNSHVSLSKDWSEHYSKVIDSIVKNQGQIEILFRKINESIATRDDELIKYAHLGQVLLILGDNVDSVSHELYKLENVMSFIRASTVHHGILSLDSIHTMINNVTNLYGRDKVIDLETREYFNIIKIGSYYIGNRIVIVYKFPIILPFTYDMYKLSIVPNHNHEVLIPPHPFLVLYKKDFKYIEAECPKSSNWYICEDKQNLQGQPSTDCIQELIVTQQKTSTCTPVTVNLKTPAYEKLDDKHYSVSFPLPTKTHISCGQDSYRVLHGSYLVILPHTCYLETTEFIIANTNDRLKGQVLKLMDLPKDDITITSTIPKVNLNSINLDQLHEINTKMSLQSPLHLDETTDYSLYHTTIPLYVVILSAATLTFGLLWRNYRMKQTSTTTETPDENYLERQPTYSIPETTRRVGTNQLPAQFTTNVFHTRCSKGGGVTEPSS